MGVVGLGGSGATIGAGGTGDGCVSVLGATAITSVVGGGVRNVGSSVTTVGVGKGFSIGLGLSCGSALGFIGSDAGGSGSVIGGGSGFCASWTSNVSGILISSNLMSGSTNARKPCNSTEQMIAQISVCS